ncbi:hypothetical protein [Pseudoxanthomonas kaohsiungensis]|jgi:hypothetical protein|uniref:Ig-like domain-containing protein n=1 Tax=Pseudoxanthomonas kaohsiungensis TaxID=283923 RepID=A0ABW3LUN8_9GAMM|nr:hypothetical protein [Pseudoxanthomonas kaohsiungensis]KAF1704550.1 hypothetical protein CSC66_02915 [Pseudoxanthomonas kaohsiungensis]
MRNAIGMGLLGLATLPALASDPAGYDPHEREIRQASELVPWCRQEAEARFVARGERTYQWSASYSDRGNALSVEGRLRVEGRDVAVTCRIARGARERYATIEIEDPKG